MVNIYKIKTSTVPLQCVVFHPIGGVEPQADVLTLVWKIDDGTVGESYFIELVAADIACWSPLQYSGLGVVGIKGDTIILTHDGTTILIGGDDLPNYLVATIFAVPVACLDGLL